MRVGEYASFTRLLAHLFEEVPQEGIEPPTYRLEVWCSVR